MRIESIGKYIVSKPSKIQIAKDDKWEETWVIDLTKQSPSDKELAEYLQSSDFRYVSIEMLFEQSDGTYILGMDYNPSLPTRTPFEFLKSSIDITMKYENFLTFGRELGEKLANESYLFSGEPDAIRIGVVNYWMSVGLCVVWQKGEDKEVRLSRLKEVLLQNTKLAKTNLNYHGMSFAINLKGTFPGICHWIKAPCSNRENDYWILDEEKIVEYLREWSDIKIIE